PPAPTSPLFPYPPLFRSRYLTGFSGSNAVYFQRPDGQGVLGTDGRYATQVEIETGQPEDIELLIENKLLEQVPEQAQVTGFAVEDRKSTRLNSSHVSISY